MAKTKDGKVVTVPAERVASNGAVGNIQVELVMIDGKLTADTAPGVRQ